MDIALLSVRLGLAIVFVIAGVAKLADRTGSRRSLQAFGMPERLIPAAALALPFLEITLALGLLPASTAWLASIGMVALLAGFVAGIAYNLARGRRPDCHCFGQLYSKPIGFETLLRNGFLVALAAVVVNAGPSGTGPSAVAWLFDLRPDTLLLGGAVVLLTVISMIQAWFLIQLFRQHGRLLLRVETAGLPAPVAAPAPIAVETGLPINAPAPALELMTLDGRAIALAELLTDHRPAVLLFVDPGCTPCQELLPEAADWRQRYADRFHLVAVSRGSVEANRQKTRGLAHVWLQHDREALDAYRVSGTPSAVLIAPDGRIASQVAGGADQIRTLVDTVARHDWRAVAPAPSADTAQEPGCGCGGQGHRRVESSGLPISAAAPDITSRSLDGDVVTLTNATGRSTLLLFWNPNCGFCRRMLNDLTRWEAEADPRDPRLVLISTGTPEANRALGLRAPIVLEEGFATGNAYGATGTPSAVLVDGEGRIASPVRVGVDEVLDLARSRRAPALAPLAP